MALIKENVYLDLGSERVNLIKIDKTWLHMKNKDWLVKNYFLLSFQVTAQHNVISLDYSVL